MKKTLRFNSATSLLIIITLSVIMTRCEWFKNDPLYTGSWEYKDVVYAGDFVYNTTRTLTLTEETFREVYVMQRDNSSTIATILATKGEIEVTGNQISFTLNAVGECLKDAQDKCTSTVEWFPKGSATYNSYMLYLEETYEGEFEADEDYLWLIRDMNNDGDTSDDGEDVEFERI